MCRLAHSCPDVRIGWGACHEIGDRKFVFRRMVRYLRGYPTPRSVYMYRRGPSLLVNIYPTTAKNLLHPIDTAMSTTAQIHIIKKANIAEHLVVPLSTTLPALCDGCVRVRSAILSLSNNNLSYAQLGEA